MGSYGEEQRNKNREMMVFKRWGELPACSHSKAKGVLHLRISSPHVLFFFPTNQKVVYLRTHPSGYLRQIHFRISSQAINSNTIQAATAEYSGSPRRPMKGPTP